MRRTAESRANRSEAVCEGLEDEKRTSCRAFEAWTGLCHGRSMPSLADVEALDTGGLAANLFVLSQGDGAGRFIVHAAGSVLDHLHEGAVGLAVEDVLPEPLDDRVVDCCVASVAAGKPTFDYASLVLDDGSLFKYRLAMMPLSDGGSRVDHLLGVIAFRRVYDDEDPFDSDPA